MSDDPYAKARERIRAEAADARASADELWARDKRERSHAEHERAARLESLAKAEDLATALQRTSREIVEIRTLLGSAGLLPNHTR